MADTTPRRRDRKDPWAGWPDGVQLTSDERKLLEQLTKWIGAFIAVVAKLNAGAADDKDIIEELQQKFRISEMKQPGGIARHLGQPEGALKGYCYTAARHLLIDLSRDAWTRRQRELPDVHGEEAAAASMALESPKSEADARLLQTERRHRVWTAVARLPAVEQEVINLRFKDELSYETIAEITGRKVATVGNDIWSAKRHLRELLAEYKVHDAKRPKKRKRRSSTEGGTKGERADDAGSAKDEGSAGGKP